MPRETHQILIPDFAAARVESASQYPSVPVALAARNRPVHPVAPRIPVTSRTQHRDRGRCSCAPRGSRHEHR